jgi:hypothetical protein
MHRYIIEREMPGIGLAEPEELREVARRSNEIADTYRPDVQWIQSYVAGDKLYCVYLAADEGLLRRYVDASGFPADRIIEIKTTLDPTSAN